MRTKHWILLLGLVFVLLAGIVFYQQHSAKPAAAAEVWVDGRMYTSLDLAKDQVLRVESERGWNELTVSGGKISVTAASCAGNDCVRCGAANAGAPIVCLPNRLSIRFTDNHGVDAVVR